VGARLNVVKQSFFGLPGSCLIKSYRVWSCLIKFEGHQTFDQT